MKVLFLFFIPIMLIVSCKSAHKKDAPGKTAFNTEELKPNQPGNFPLGDTFIDGRQQYTYIKSVVEKNGMFSINADYIQFLTGDAALEAAKKNGDADTLYDDKGKITDIGVDDDYYIVNENSKIRTLHVSLDVVIETISSEEDPSLKMKRTSVNEFKKQDYTSPFILTMRNDTVVAIREVYLP